MSEHTPEFRNLQPPFSIKEDEFYRQIVDASGKHLVESAKSKAAHIDRELAEVVRQMAAAPLLVEACKKLLRRVESDCESDNLKTPEGDLGRAALSHLAGSDNG